MAEIIKETVTTKVDNTDPVVVTQTAEKADTSQTIERLIYFFFGALDILLLFRLILKFTGANAASAFVRIVYSLTGIFIMPFEGIFRRGYAPGLETTAVFEPSTLVALIVYMVLAWGIVKLLRVLSGSRVDA